MSFTVKLRSKNPSARDLKIGLSNILCSRPIVVRLGSRTPIEKIFPRSHSRAIEINSIEGITNSRDKLLMKRCFSTEEVKTANWGALSENRLWNNFPAIIKQRGSHGGGGIYMINTFEELSEFLRNHLNVNNYIIEEYKNFTKEYRLHVTKNGCFYTCRKMLKNDATDRWHRHDNNCVWILEDNPLFERPSNWNEIEGECVKALNSVGLDTGACDIKVQSEKGKRSSFLPDFIIMEINSAPSMGEITTIKYLEKLTEIISEYDTK